MTFDQEWVWALTRLILPPGGYILLGLLGLILSRRFLGKFLILLSLAGIYLFSTPVFINILAEPLEQIPPVHPEQITAQKAGAIVVLGGGSYLDAPEYRDDTVSGLLLERLRYAALFARKSGLPIVTSGGSDWRDSKPEALLSKQILEEEFRVKVVASEGASRTTWENALLTASLLQQKGIKRIVLVTHAWHMPRALAAFQKQGLEVIPAPMGYIGNHKHSPRFQDWLPNDQAARQGYWLLHEYLGGFWYRLRNQVSGLIDQIPDRG